jgi:hypothetical protein
MPFFSETVTAAMAGHSIGASFLVFMDFREAPRRWWTGFGTLVAGGEEWTGLGKRVSIDGIEGQTGTAAPQVTFTLSGVDPDIVVQARAASDRVKDRRVVVYLQFFHTAPTDAGDQVHGNLDSPYAIWSGKMDQVRFTAEGPSLRTITVTAETLWASRNRPRYGLYTDRDQQGRFPGDRGLEQVPSLVSKTIRWPRT